MQTQKEQIVTENFFLVVFRQIWLVPRPLIWDPVFILSRILHINSCYV